MDKNIKRFYLYLRILFRNKFNPKNRDNLSLKFRNAIFKYIEDKESVMSYSLDNILYIYNTSKNLFIKISNNSYIYISDESETHLYMLTEQHYKEVVKKFHIKLELQNIKIDEKIINTYNNFTLSFLNKL